MGPLIVNDIIIQNTNFFLAFLIGIGFGFVLESSGFSSSRKLVGVFYGYDTVVLKVFFTAAIVAMLGLLLMSLFNWIDLDLVYNHWWNYHGSRIHHWRILYGNQLLRSSHR